MDGRYELPNASRFVVDAGEPLTLSVDISLSGKGLVNHAKYMNRRNVLTPLYVSSCALFDVAGTRSSVHIFRTSGMACPAIRRGSILSGR